MNNLVIRKNTSNLYVEIGEYLSARLSDFKHENTGSGSFPDALNSRHWDYILDTMITAFSYAKRYDEIQMENIDKYGYVQGSILNAEVDSQIKNGLAMFADYYMHLWI